MTYHTVHLKISTGSIDEKRDAVRLLYNRSAAKASRLLIEAAKDASSQVVFLAALGMRIGPREVQDRYKQSYIELASHSDYRIRTVALGKLDVFEDKALADLFRKAALSSEVSERITASTSLVSLGFADEVRATFPTQLPYFIFHVLTDIVRKGTALPQDIATLDSIKDVLPGDREAAGADPNSPFPYISEEDFNTLRRELVQQVDERDRISAFDRAVADLATKSKHLARHFSNFNGTEKQVDRAFRHLEKGGSQITEVLIVGARHPNPKLRSSSMSLLADFKDPRTFDIAFSMLDDSDKFAKIAASDALGKLGDARSLDRLTEIACSSDVTDDGFSLSYSALEAITRLNVDQKHALITVYRNGNKQIAPIAVEMLTKLKDDSLIPVYERVLQEDNPRSALYALRGLAETDTKHCREVVKQHLHDERPKVRALAEHWGKEWGLT